jgi:hypothetical protein
VGRPYSTTDVETEDHVGLKGGKAGKPDDEKSTWKKDLECKELQRQYERKRRRKLLENTQKLAKQQAQDRSRPP